MKALGKILPHFSLKKMHSVMDANFINGATVHRHKRRNSWLIFLCIWIVVMGLSSLQRATSIYQSLMLREVFTVFLLFGLSLNIRSRKQLKLLVITYLIILYIALTVTRTTIYNSTEMVHITVRLVQYMILIVAVPAFIRSWQEARNLYIFLIFFCTLVSLTAPLQEITGPLPLYETNWEWQHGRAEFARYLSLFGDPNVAAIFGGVLPLSLFALQKKRGRKEKLKTILIEIAIWLASILVVAYSLSFTGIVLLVCSAVIRLLVERSSNASILRLGIVMICGVAIFSTTVGDRIEGTIHRFLRPADFYAYSSGSTHLFSQISWRLFYYLDVNDTIIKMFFGSTYDIVTPAGYINPNAIKTHNGYKEIYIAGGLIGLGLYMAIFLLTASKAMGIILRKRKIFMRLKGVALSTSWIYLLLLAVMFGFPLYHYNGIGIVFWITAGLIHVIHDRFGHSRV